MTAADRARVRPANRATFGPAARHPSTRRNWLLGHALNGLLSWVIVTSPDAAFAQESARATKPNTFRIVRLDGTEVSGQLTAITADGKLIGPSLPQPFAWDDVWHLARVTIPATPATTPATSPDSPIKPPVNSPTTAKSSASPGPIIVESRHGARLVITDVALDDDQVTVTWPMAAAPLTFAIDDLHALWFERPDKVVARAPSLAKPSADTDRVVVLNSAKPGVDSAKRDTDSAQGDAQAKVQILPGLVTGLSGESVSLERDGRSYEVARRSVLAVVMAEPPGESRPEPAAAIHCTDGSELPAASITGADLDKPGGTWLVQAVSRQPIRIASLNVQRIAARSPRLTLLSTLAPVQVTQKTLVVESLEWRRNRSVDGQALQLAGQIYSTGIGTQAGTRLTFDLTDDKRPHHAAKQVQPRFERTLFATVGLNDRTRRRGDCQVAILGDNDSRLWTARLRGGDRPLAVRLPLRDNRQLTLVVEPGENLDLGDHVDWCDVRLVSSR